jgi:hypothetical protein
MENCLYQKNSNSPTATCLILTTDQARYMILIYFDKKISFSLSRSMITNLGAANEFTIDYLNNSENWLYVERAQIFYVAVRFI